MICFTHVGSTVVPLLRNHLNIEKHLGTTTMFSAYVKLFTSCHIFLCATVLCILPLITFIVHTDPSTLPDSSTLQSSLDPISVPEDGNNVATPHQQESSLDSSLFTPLYPDADIILCGALCSIMQFFSANNLTYTAISDLLKLLAILLPAQNLIPSSFYVFKNFFKQFSPIHDHKRICLKCASSDCVCRTQSSAEMAHLVHIDICKPLEHVLQGISLILFVPSYIFFVDNWQALKPNTSADDEILQDVRDGAALHPLTAENRFFSNPYNIALSLSTDGVPLYKSSTVSFWPVYLMVLNLPPHIRVHASNIILCGVWVGPAKPVMSLLLSPVAEFLEKLSTAGMEINTSDGIVTICAKLVLGIFDLPAKALILCAKQYNGEFGCSVYLHPGKRLPNGS